MASVPTTPSLTTDHGVFNNIYEAPPCLKAFEEIFPAEVPTIGEETRTKEETRAQLILRLNEGEILPVNYLEDLVRYDNEEYNTDLSCPKALSVDDILEDATGLNLLIFLISRARGLTNSVNRFPDIKAMEEAKKGKMKQANTYILTTKAYYRALLEKGISFKEIVAIHDLEPFKID